MWARAQLNITEFNEFNEFISYRFRSTFTENIQPLFSRSGNCNEFIEWYKISTQYWFCYYRVLDVQIHLEMLLRVLDVQIYVGMLLLLAEVPREVFLRSMILFALVTQSLPCRFVPVSHTRCVTHWINLQDKVSYVDPPQLNAIRHTQVPDFFSMYNRRCRPKICTGTFPIYCRYWVRAAQFRRKLLLDPP
eukprot:SAG11_NODE_13091_length_670_cov_4.746060_1_plen_190_part_10